MLNRNAAFSSFSVNDIQKAREFYGGRSGSNFPAVRKVSLLSHSPAPPKLSCTLHRITSQRLSLS